MDAVDSQFESPEDREKKEDENLMESVVARLTETFDSVRIIGTKSVGTTTRLVTRGGGDYFAQVGAVRDWLAEKDEDTRVQARKNNE